MKKQNNVFLGTIEHTSPLNPRDALYGGRTNALKLYHKCTEPGEEIHYIDYTSLYPYVQKYGVFPTHHPDIITENFDKKYFGIIKCRILPPCGLYIPVLPVRIIGKLLFPLCRKCAEEKQTDKYHHTDNERALEGL